MKARQFVAIVALHAQPVGPYVTPGEREEALSDALRGVVLGGYDELVCAWMIRTLDVPTMRVIVSIIERVRAAGIQEAVDAELALRARHPQPPQTYGQHPRQRAIGRHHVPGNSGPGF